MSTPPPPELLEGFIAVMSRAKSQMSCTVLLTAESVERKLFISSSTPNASRVLVGKLCRVHFWANRAQISKLWVLLAVDSFTRQG